MGMDLYGVSPSSDEGEYFRSNVWWWRPLWSYVLDQCEFLTDEQAEMGHFNDGFEYDCETAEAIGDTLIKTLRDGTADALIAEYYSQLSKLPMEKCQWCNGTGIRTDTVGVEQGMPTEQLDEAAAIALGRTHGTCNACSGVGESASVATWYHIDRDHIERFAKFCLASNGFTIC